MIIGSMTDRQRNGLREDEQAPATRGDVDELTRITADNFTCLEGRIVHIEETMVTKDNLENFATKDDLESFATKDDLKNVATKDDIRRLEAISQSLLVVLDENNQILKEVRRLPERVTRLERYVFRR